MYCAALSETKMIVISGVRTNRTTRTVHKPANLPLRTRTRSMLRPRLSRTQEPKNSYPDGDDHEQHKGERRRAVELQQVDRLVVDLGGQHIVAAAAEQCRGHIG